MNAILPLWSLFFLIWSGTASAAAPPIDMLAGLWKTKIKVEMPNGRMPFSFSSERCLSPKDPVPNASEGKNCSTDEVKTQEDSVSWVLRCTGEKGLMTGIGNITFQGENFSGKMSIDIVEKTRSATLIYHLKGEYLGHCPLPNQ